MKESKYNWSSQRLPILNQWYSMKPWAQRLRRKNKKERRKEGERGRKRREGKQREREREEEKLIHP